MHCQRHPARVSRSRARMTKKGESNLTKVSANAPALCSAVRTLLAEPVNGNKESKQ